MLQHQAEISQEEIKQLVSNLNNKQEETRLEAERRLNQLNSESFKSLLTYLAAENKQWRQQRRVIWGLLGGGIGFFLLVALIKWDFDSFTSMGGLVALLGATAATTQQQKDATRLLAQYGDKQAVGVLTEALEFEDRDLIKRVQERLTALLPTLQASDADLLNAEQRARLHKALLGKETKFARAILQALAQVGDSKAIPNVERLAKGEGAAKHDASLREVAAECLEYLHIRVEAERNRQTLLRAADGREVAPDTLLRPAEGVSDTDPNLLLRSASSEEEPANANLTSL